MPRYILTGAPGAGKTALLRRLELNGYTVVEEAATDTIALDAAVGRVEPWRHPSFVDRVLDLQVRRQDAVADSGSPVFFDRSPVCTLALGHHLGFAVPDRLAREAERAREVYEPTVFLVRDQGFVTRTEARRISHEDALAFERLHERIYRDLGFRLVDVPAAPLDERVAVVQQAVTGR